MSHDLIGDIDRDFSFVWDRSEELQPDSAGNVRDRDDYQMIVAIIHDIFKNTFIPDPPSGYRYRVVPL